MIQHLPPEPNEIWPLRHISMKVMKMEIRDTVKLEIWRGIKFCRSNILAQRLFGTQPPDLISANIYT